MHDTSVSSHIQSYKENDSDELSFDFDINEEELRKVMVSCLF